MKIVEKNFGKIIRSGQPKQSFTKLFSQKQKKTKAFTLIELLVVITIIFMLMMTVYAPYSLYQQKAKLKLASRELSQSFYEAKNMAVSGIKEQRIDEEDYTTENMAVGLFLNTDEGKNSEVIFYAFPHDIDTSTIVLPGNSSIIKTTKLQEGVRMNDLSGHKNLLFFFNAISGDLEIFTFSETGAKNEVLDERIEIRFSYMDATSSSLQRKIIYFRNTNIVDYE